MADVGDRERIEEVAAVPRTPVVPDERRPQLSQPPPNDAAGLGAATAGGLAGVSGKWYRRFKPAKWVAEHWK